MPKRVTIRGVDDAVYAELAHRAARAGITVPELLRRHLARVARLGDDELDERYGGPFIRSRGARLSDADVQELMDRDRR